MLLARSGGIDFAVSQRHLDGGAKTLPKRNSSEHTPRADRRSNFC